MSTGYCTGQIEEPRSMHKALPHGRTYGECARCFGSIKTNEEMSVVCSSSVSLNSERPESGWSCIKVLGPLDFSLTGILAEISIVLAKDEISIFALSTFDTDYILVKSEKLHAGKQALQRAGYAFKN